LGTSSTLINNIAQWAQIDAFELLKNSFGGSGYDIACAQNDIAITYQIKNNNPIVTPINFDPVFKDQLYFVHLNKKQNSKEGIAHYKSLISNKFAFAEEITQLTNAVLDCSSMLEFEMILSEHEKIIGSILHQKPVQKMLFSDYFGQTKSLGAWGGDFILATGNEGTPSYFKNKGFPTVIPYQNMILCNKK
jgi:mevalonate kinase